MVTGIVYFPVAVDEEDTRVTLTVLLLLNGMEPTACWLAPDRVNGEFAGVLIITLFITPPVFRTCSSAVTASPGWTTEGWTDIVFAASIWCSEMTTGIVTGVFLVPVC